MYLSIAIKLLVGMLGVIFFLRISGKTQMAQLTPLDSVNSFVLGALVGGVIYNPDTPVWYLVFAFAVWTAANVSLRYLMRFHRIRRAIKGDSVMLVRDRRLVMREFRRNGLEMEQFRTNRQNRTCSSTGARSWKTHSSAAARASGGSCATSGRRGTPMRKNFSAWSGHRDADSISSRWRNPTAGMRQRRRFRQTKDGTAGNGLQDNTGERAQDSPCERP